MTSRVNFNFIEWRNRDFARVGDKIGTPPAKGAASDDGMLALGHELHVAEALIALVPVDKEHFVLIEVKTKDLGILLAPVHTARIGEKHEHRVFNMATHVPYGTAEIAVFIAIAIGPQQVAPAGMDCHRIDRLQIGCNVGIFL